MRKLIHKTLNEKFQKEWSSNRPYPYEEEVSLFIYNDVSLDHPSQTFKELFDADEEILLVSFKVEDGTEIYRITQEDVDGPIIVRRDTHDNNVRGTPIPLPEFDKITGQKNLKITVLVFKDKYWDD